MQNSVLSFKKTEPTRSNTEHEIMNRVNLLTQFLKSRNYNVAPYSEKAIEKLSTLLEEKKLKALDQLEKLSWLFIGSVGILDKEPPKGPFDIHPEGYLVDKAMRFYNLKLRDDFWKTVEPHDVLEIYNDEGIQLFRTFNFFHTSGYSLTDLLVNEWYVLWERPKFILQEIFKYSEGVLTGTMPGVTQMQIPEHIIKEIYSGTDEMLDFTPRSLLVKFGNICPLYSDKNEVDPKVRGIIVSSKCSTNTYGKEDTKKVVIF